MFPRLWAPLIAYHLNKRFHFICSPKLSQIYFAFLEPFDWKFTFLFALKHGNSGHILIGNQAIKGNGLNTGLTSLAALHTASFPGSLSEEKRERERERERERARVRGCFAQTISHPIMQYVLGVLYINKQYKLLTLELYRCNANNPPNLLIMGFVKIANCDIWKQPCN